jgi:hypothetical protein
MVTVAVWVASLPGAVGRITSFGTGPLLLGSAGLMVLGLLRSPLRLAGALLLAVATLWAIRTPPRACEVTLIPVSAQSPLLDSLFYKIGNYCLDLMSLNVSSSN